MTGSTKWLAALTALLLVFAAACSGDDDDGAVDAGPNDDDAAQPAGDDDGADEADQGDADQGDAPASGEFGTITIDGDEYGVTTLNRCIPFSKSDDDLDLQALGGGVKINLYAVGGTINDVSVDGSTVTSEYGSIAFGSDPVIHDQSVDGDRTTGSATLGDSTGGPTTVEVSWDVEIPDEVRDCSL